MREVLHRRPLPKAPAAERRSRSRLLQTERIDVPLYFFDIHNSGAVFDDTGTELPGLLEVRDQALRTLPAIAAEQIPMGEDHRLFTVLVKDESGHPVYAANLSFVGTWLSRPPTK